MPNCLESKAMRLIACHNAHIWKIYDGQLFKMPSVFLSSLRYTICIESKRYFENNNKGKITLKIIPWAE